MQPSVARSIAILSICSAIVPRLVHKVYTLTYGECMLRDDGKCIHKNVTQDTCVNCFMEDAERMITYVEAQVSQGI